MLLGVQTHFSQGWGLGWLADVQAVGATQIRDSEPWSAVEKAPGVYNFSSFSYVAAAKSDGLSTSMTFSVAGNALYDGGYSPYDAAGDAAYAKYVVATINASKGEITTIEIGNEINSSGFKVPTGVNANQAYVNLLEATYNAVKAADPQVTVLLGSTNMIGTGFLDGLFKLGALNYCDGVAVHPYDANPDAVGMELQALKADMALYGTVKPIYATEFGLATSNPNLDPAYMLQMVAEMGAQGVAAASWYSLLNESGFPNMGLFQTNGTAAPAAAAYSFIQSTLSPLGNPVQIDTNIPRAEVFSYDGGKAVVMWGDTRGVTFTGTPQFFSATGASVAPITSLSMTPVVVTGDFSFTLGSSPVVADTLLDYNTSTWSYFAKTANGTLNPITMQNENWQSFIGSRYYQPLAIFNDQVTPAGNAASPIEAVQRYTAPVAETVQVVGSWSVAAAGAGGEVFILLNNHLIYSGTLNDSLSVSNLTVSLKPGDTLDFAVGPNQTGLHDQTAEQVQLVQAAPTTSTITSNIYNATPGADTIVLNASALSSTAPAPIINNFSLAGGDKISLAQFDAGLVAAGGHALTWLGTAAFDHHADEIHYANTAAGIVVSGDLHGLGNADFSFTLAGVHTVQQSEFIF